MARYNPRSRRRRRPRYRRRGENRMRLYIVLTIVLCATILVALKWRGRQAVDPNDVNAVGQELVAATEFQQSDTPATVNTAPPQPEVTQTISPQPERAIEPLPVVQPALVVEAANPEVNTMIAEAMALLREAPEAKLIEARDRLNRILDESMSTHQRVLIKDELAKLAQKWLFSAKVFPGDTLCETYVVRAGDNLERIGRRYKVPHEVLMTINGIRRPESLRAGVNLKVVKGPFHVKVYKSSFTMDLLLQENQYVKSYPIGLGKVGHETPTGLWAVKIGGKMIQPQWTDPNGHTFYAGDPDYPLGSRWIGLEGLEGDALGRQGFAIHGTKEPEQIGQRGSLGCIRLHNGSVVEVYTLLTPALSQVRVVE